MYLLDSFSQQTIVNHGARKSQNNRVKVVRICGLKSWKVTNNFVSHQKEWVTQCCLKKKEVRSSHFRFAYDFSLGTVPWSSMRILQQSDEVKTSSGWTLNPSCCIKSTVIVLESSQVFTINITFNPESCNLKFDGIL
jgi:hypothetical protein